MSKYTTEVRYICESYAGYEESVGYDKVDIVIANSREKIFDFNYPIFDEDYRSVLETKILRYYYTREICAETVGRWKLFLYSKMNEIMPYYNILYNAQIELMKHKLFDDTDYYVDHEGEKHDVGVKDGSSRSTDSGSDSTSTQDTPVRDTWEYFSDTPQGDVIAMESDEFRYLTNATHTHTTGEGSDRQSEITYGKVNVGKIDETNNLDSTDGYLNHIFGKVNPRTYASVYKEYIDSIINIDMEVIRKLGDLFFNLY